MAKIAATEMGLKRWEGTRLTKLDLLSLQYALLASDFGSFRAVASIFGVKTSVVSRRIRSVEDVLGVSLFHRQTRGAVPTASGDIILDRCRLILDEVLSLEKMANSHGAGTIGSLRIGVVDSIAGGGANALLSAFVEQFRSVRLSVIENSPRRHLAELRALRLDAFLVVEGLEAAGLEKLALWKEPLLLALSSNHALASSDVISWHDITGEQFIVSRAHPGPEIYEYIVCNRPNVEERLKIRTFEVARESLLALVGLNQGVTLVGSAEANVTYPGVVFRPLGDEYLSFCVVWNAKNDNPSLRRFLSLGKQRAMLPSSS